MFVELMSKYKTDHKIKKRITGESLWIYHLFICSVLSVMVRNTQVD